MTRMNIDKDFARGRASDGKAGRAGDVRKKKAVQPILETPREKSRGERLLSETLQLGLAAAIGGGMFWIAMKVLL